LVTEKAVDFIVGVEVGVEFGFVEPVNSGFLVGEGVGEIEEVCFEVELGFCVGVDDAL